MSLEHEKAGSLFQNLDKERRENDVTTGKIDIDLNSLSTWLPTSLTTPSIESLRREFEIDRTANVICNFLSTSLDKNIALQFPDSLLLYAAFICNALTKCVIQISCSNDYFVYVLGDTSYGECCVDEVNALHLNTNLIVHYGIACLSPTHSLPVLYVFPRDSVPLSVRLDAFLGDEFADGADDDVEVIVILYDIGLFSYFDFHNRSFRTSDEHFVKLDEIDNHKKIVLANVRLENPYDVQLPNSIHSNTQKLPTMKAIGHLQYDTFTVSQSKTSYLWLTTSKTPSPSIRNAALSLTTGPDPCSSFKMKDITKRNSRTETIDTQRILRSRFVKLQKVEQAQRIGILAGTLGISGHTEMISRLSRTIEFSGRSCYILLMGKLNAAKLANFTDIDVFVLIACPLNSLLSEELQRECMQAVVTPAELEASLLHNGDIFSGSYSTDFTDLLSTKLVLDEESEGEGVLVGRNGGEWTVSVNGAGGGADFLNERSWKGLVYDKGVDDTPIEELSVAVEEGQHGIASGYDREREETVHNE